MNGIMSCRDEYEDYVCAVSEYIQAGYPEAALASLMNYISAEYMGVKESSKRSHQLVVTLRALAGIREDFSINPLDQGSKKFPFDESFVDQVEWSSRARLQRLPLSGDSGSLG